MLSSNIQGYAARSAGKHLEPFTYSAPELGKNDIRVSVSHCGVCHTDIHAIEDYYGITTFPFVPGHEIVGNVSALGEAVSGFKSGDRVAIGWLGRSCGKCEWCLKGEEHLCMDIVSSGTWVPYGGFSSSVVADHRFAYKLPEAMPSEVAAVLTCAGITVYNPLKLHAVRPGQKIGIISVGGLGHLAIQFAHALGYGVTAISSTPEKEEEALGFGAHHFIVSHDMVSLEKIEYCFDLVLCTASGKINWEALLRTLKKNGRLILVGFQDLELNSTDLVAHQLSITGSFIGSRSRMKEMFSFAQSHKIDPAIEIMPMSKINDALQKVKENRARYRIVLVNE